MPVWARAMGCGPAPRPEPVAKPKMPAWASAISADAAERMEQFADIVERDAELLLDVMIEAAGKQRGRATLALDDEFACDGLSCMADDLRQAGTSRYGLTKVADYGLTEVAEWLDGLVEAATRRRSDSPGPKSGSITAKGLRPSPRCGTRSRRRHLQALAGAAV